VEDSRALVLVTGATGYVGGRLVPRLLAAGYPVRVMVRDATRLGARDWLGRVEVAEGDVTRPDSLAPALKDVKIAYYLVHSMAGGRGFEETDVRAAEDFALAAHAAGVVRIIYLGGLGDPAQHLSSHLRSRQETAVALRKAGIPVTEFRAAVIVGSGSVSFEMIRYLTERVPLMVCPRWVYTRIQPIGIEDALQYLVEAIAKAETAGAVVEIGGANVLSYAEMMLGYARIRGLRRLLLPTPVLSPRLSSYWVHWVTPIPASIARPLIEGLRSEVVLRDDSAARLFPEIHPASYEAAVRLALRDLGERKVETNWCGAMVSNPGVSAPVCLVSTEGMIVERRERLVQASAATVYQVFVGLGGDRGWLALDWTWKLRGLVDRILGGVGFRRGRRDPDDLRVGDALDFWRVESVEPGRLLRLRAEMKVPGLAWLEFEADRGDDAPTLLRQTAFFAPRGIVGLAYWWLLYPVHALLFSLLARRIARRAEMATGISPAA
jgi:uncharacterized protein YbjT (DUF2867 family)